MSRLPALEDAVAALRSSVPGVELIVARVVEHQPVTVELTRGDGVPAGRCLLHGSPLRAVLEDGATLVAEDCRDADMLRWPWNGGTAARAVAVPAGHRPGRRAPGLVIAARRTGPPLTREELPRVEDLARLLAGLVAAPSPAVASGGRGSDDSLNTIVHELRTPLSVIAGYVTMLREGVLGRFDEDALRALMVVAAKTEEARLLVDELLLSSRLEADRISPVVQPLNLSGLARAAAARAEARATLLGGEVGVTDPVEPVVVAGDVQLLGRVLDNLVNNALLYSSSRPRVRLEVAGEESRGVLRVVDNGDGIREAMRERVFEKFVRADDRGSRAGSGLGLYLGRQIAERMGGALLLERSEPGVGSVFALELPRPG